MSPSHCVAALVVLSVAEAVSQDAGFQYPIDVAVAGDGDVYVADKNLPGLWKVTDGKASVFFQASKTFRTPLNRVHCVAIDGEGNVLAGDPATREVYRFTADGKPEPLTHGFIGIPSAIAVAADGTIYVGDLESRRIWSFPKEGLKEGEEPKEVALVAGIRDLTFDADGKLLVVTNTEDPVRRLKDDGTLETVVAGTPFQFSHKLVVGEDGSLFVTDNYAGAIWKVPAGGGEPAAFLQGEPLVKPVGLARRGDDLIVADPHAKAIFVVTPEGKASPLVGAK